MNTKDTEQTGQDAQKREAHQWKEYEQCARLEQELVRSRWTFFTAMLSVSFVIAGLAVSQRSALGPLLGKAGFSFGWLIFMAGFYHYWWFHVKCHDLREYLCRLEGDLKIEPYKIRTKRPRLWGVSLRYHWIIDTIAIVYTVLLLIILIG